MELTGSESVSPANHAILSAALHHLSHHITGGSMGNHWIVLAINSESKIVTLSKMQPLKKR